ncbi:MAG: DUF3035 domain-containing protein [Kiloniellaceae bacterium]
MMRRGTFRLAGVAALVLALTACEGFRKELGLTKQAPDEFRVVSRAPLTLPPDFNLRPPEPGIPRPQEGTPTQQARRAVFRAEKPKAPSLDEVIPADGRSLGERALLKAAGADKAEPNIRVIVDRETTQLNLEDEDFIETLIFWRQPRKPGVVVDAEEEARRLRENAALGKAVTEGETPTIKRRKKALLEGLF